MIDKTMLCKFSDPRYAIPGSVPQYSPNMDFEPKHVKLELYIDVKKGTVRGTCHVRLRSFGTKALVFNAVNMKITAVRMGKKAVRFKHDGDKLEVEKNLKYGEEATLSIDYRLANTKLGVYFVRPDKKYPKKPWQAWTHSEAQDARHWYPCLDTPEAKITTETVITVSSEFFALSNGRLVDVKSRGRTKTYHWKMSRPHSPYLLMFAVGKFVEVRDKWRNIDVLYYCEKEKTEQIKRAFGTTPKMLEFFSSKIGVDYPYEKYAQVAIEDFFVSGMEHTTATTQTNLVLLDKIAAKEVFDSPISLAAHELAHQWFGDLLTCKDWSHAWLNESFATYFDALYLEHAFGQEYFQWDMHRNAQAYFDEDANSYRRPIVTNIYVYPDDLFDRHLYQKGSWVLHMIRKILGDDMWWKAINHYVCSHADSSVETADLMQSIRTVTGKNMNKFFDQWVFKAGHPEYRVTYSWDSRKKEASVRVVQMQRADEDTQLFSMPITLEFHTRNGIKKFDVVVENKQHLFKYKLPSEPANFLFDPDEYILKKLDMTKPKKMWYQDLKSKNLITKIRAAQFLAASASQQDITAIENGIYAQKFWGSQIELILALSAARTDAEFKVLVRALEKIRHPRVRRAILDSLGQYRDERVLKIAKKYSSARDSYIVPAEALRTAGRTKAESALPLLKQALKRESWSDIVRQHAVAGIASVGSEKSLQMLKEIAKQNYPHRVRASAIRELGAAGKGDRKITDILIEFTHENLVVIQSSAVYALGLLGDERAVKRLKDITQGQFENRVKRDALEAIRKIQPWTDLDVKSDEVRMQIQELMQENQELKKKLKKR